MGDIQTSGLVVIDVHAHYYAGFGAGEFFSASWRNLGKAAGVAATNITRALVLLETRDSDWLRGWREQGLGPDGQGWVVEATGESLSLWMKHPDGRSLLLIGGRQFNTLEGLEVVLIGCDRNALQDGLPLRNYLDSRAEDCLPVIPWGAGKWLGARGKLINALLADGSAGFFLGDNAGRPAALPAGAQFRLARAAGIAVLPGSDPLPIAAHATRAGTAGCRVTADVSGAAPGASVLKALGVFGAEPQECFGIGSALLPFVRDQITLRLCRLG